MASATWQRGLAEAIGTAFRASRETAPDDRLGEQFAAPHEALWSWGKAEVVIEYPEGPDHVAVTVIQGGDGETVYEADASAFSDADAAEAVTRFLSTT